MKIYVVDDSVQDGADCTNALEDSLLIGKITKNIIVCSINESLPEKIFKKINCDVATSTRAAMAVGLTIDDFCFSYRGKDKEELLETVRKYCNEKNPDMTDYKYAFRYQGGNKGIVYAPINNGYEFTFYKGKDFNCNYDELNIAFNTKRENCHIDLEGLVNHLAYKFDAEVLDTLPKERKKVENRRGIIKSCNTGNNVFGLNKKTYRVRCPMVLDNGVWKPQVTLCGFSGMNNTEIKGGYITGDIEVKMQDDEETVKKILEEKGGVEWVG